MRILFNSSVGLGDSAYLYMVLRGLKRKRPEAAIDVMAWSGPSKLFVLSGVLGRVIEADKQIEKFTSRGLTDFDLYRARAGEIGGYDLIYNLQHHRASAYLCRLAQPGQLVGVDPDPGTENWYDRVHSTAPGEHILDSLVRLVSETLKLDGLPLEPSMVLPERPGQPIRELIAGPEGFSGPIVGLHPGAAGTARLWPYEHWGEVARCLLDEEKAQVILFGSDLRRQGQQPVLDKPLADIIQRISGDRCLDLAGRLSTPSLAFIIEELDLFVGLDTGPTHLAELLGTPTVALFRLFSPDHFNRWRPRGDHVRLLSHEDLSRIEPADVTRLARELLATRRPVGALT